MLRNKLTLGILMLALLVPASFAQTGNYGLKPFAIANQRIASSYNYDVDSIFGSGLGQYQFPSLTCLSALNLGGRSFNPFIAADTIKIVDITSANTETVAQTAATISGGYCTVNPTSPANAHTSYHLRSGTCGLVPAMKDLGGSGTVNVDQAFYDAGCTASTITGTVTGAAGAATIFIHDMSAGQEAWYGWNGTAYKQVQVNSNSHFGFGNPDVVGTGTSPLTVTFQKAYTVAPVCMAVDQSATPGAIQVAPTTTAVVLTGTGGHTLAYACFGNPN